MAKFGRFVCVGLPFALTVASLICILIVMLTGITSNGLYLFKANTKDLSIAIADLSSLTKRADHMDLAGSAVGDAVTSAVTGAAGDLIKTTNITASDLGLFDSYTVSLWNYCYTTDDTTTCLPAKFDWAADATNITTTLTNIATANGVSFADETLINAVKTFSLVVKWTEVVYILAAILAAVELVVGLFAFCSRVGSCCTFIVSAASTIAVIAAAGLSTFMAAVIVGTLTALNKYGVSASFNTSFLAISWLAVAFSLGASLFWLFSICCCAPDHSARRDKHKSSVGEKVPYGGYQRVNDPFLPNNHHATPQQTGYIPATTAPAAAQRYEPYSHSHV